MPRRRTSVRFGDHDGHVPGLGQYPHTVGQDGMGGDRPGEPAVTPRRDQARRVVFRFARQSGEQDEMDPKVDESFEALLRFMRDSRGFDFTGYKRASLMVRRVRTAAHARRGGLDVLWQLYRLSRGPPRGVRRLFNTILINVTAFFRDRRPGSSWDRGHPADPRGKRPDDADPGLERRLRLGRRGLHLAMVLARRWGRRRSGTG